MISQYLTAFFETLTRLKHDGVGNVPHALCRREGDLFVLVSVGDLWVQLRLDQLGPDPVRAAEAVYARWQALSPEATEEALFGR